MSFNAGGANVAGVQQTEPGILTFDNGATTYSNAGGETINVDFVVPAGKKWIIKSWSYTTGSFVGTFAMFGAQFGDVGGTNIATAYSNATTSYFFPSIPITLTEGQIIRFNMRTTAWTSGQQNCKCAYQEVNV